MIRLFESDDSRLHHVNELECNSGGHNLYVHDNLESLRSFYSARCKFALDHNIVTVLVTYFEPPKTVYPYLENAGIDVAKDKRSGSLFVLDALNQFFGTGPDFHQFMKLLDKGAIAQGKKGVCILASLDAFVLHGEARQTIEFEELIQADHTLTSTSMTCMYHVETFMRLSQKEQDQIIRQHQKVIR